MWTASDGVRPAHSTVRDGPLGGRRQPTPLSTDGLTGWMPLAPCPVGCGIDLSYRRALRAGRCAPASGGEWLAGGSRYVPMATIVLRGRAEENVRDLIVAAAASHSRRRRAKGLSLSLG